MKYVSTLTLKKKSDMDTIRYELKQNGNTGLYYFESFGFLSAEFELEEADEQRMWFSRTIMGDVQGTVQ